MASPAAAPVVTVGGKGSSLSSSAVYSVSRGLSLARVDAAVLEKLSSPAKKPHIVSPLPAPPSASGSVSPRFLTQEEARAALVVLLNKFALSDASGARPAIPALVEEALGLDGGLEALDFGSPLGILSSLCRLIGKKIEDVGVTADEIGIVDGALVAASAGAAAVLDSASSAISTVLDAVAALSCEAAGADVAAFDLAGSGDGFSVKDETDVAGDMKVLLFGSKLTGRIDGDEFRGIPAVHGSFRSAVKALHGRTRIELNSTIRIRKKSGDPWNHEKETAFAGFVLPLAVAARAAGKSSLARATSALRSIGEPDLRSTATELFEKNCPSFDVLKDWCQSVSLKAASEADDTEVLHSAHELLLKLREVLAWEAAVALFVIENDDSIEKASPSNVEANGGDTVSDKKTEKKKKKKKTLGRGTAAILQRIRADIDGGSVVDDWARELFLYFDPKCSRLESLLKEVKEIVESNEVRRLPKIPKGTRDFGKEQMAIRERAFSIIVDIFKMHGATALDTPVFELRETLMGKYGEDSKLIYDLADQIKLNHRKLLDGMLEICGVSSEKFRTVCSSIDKLDKQPFEQIKRELVEEKGLTVETAERIGDYVKKRGPPFEILSCLKEKGSKFLEHEGSLIALNDLEILFKALDKSKSIHKVVFDLSLARGLDYYTGMIFEAVFKGATQVGSIAAGGRYDNLVGMFSGKHVPAVGISLGIERVFTIMEQLAKDRNQAIRATETQVLVAVLGKDLTLAAELVSEFWDAKIKAEFGIHKKVMKHIDRAKQSGIPWMVLVGELELEKGIVKLKNIEANIEEEVPRDKIVEELKGRLDMLSRFRAVIIQTVDTCTCVLPAEEEFAGGGKALQSLNFIHVWKLENLFSASPRGEGSWHHSAPFEAGGYRWKLALHPMCLKPEDDKRYWSLFLRPEDAIALPSHFVVETVLETSILNESGNKHDKRKVAYKFRRGKAEDVESPFLISLQTLKCPSSGFLVVEIPNATVHAEEVGTSSQLEEKKIAYTWKIDGFSKLAAKEYKSGPFLIGSNIWNLILFPKGKHQDKFLSLYLELDNASRLQSSEKVYADFSLSVVNQSHGISLEKRTNHHFSSKSSDWGYPRFLSLGDLHDPSKGFLVNDACQVKVVFYSCN
ncbi:hypothetical protein Taro_040342 [Colocasia esculenta]|uniref:histidine--tRNA ligase n=1 Tax=Colocasia esculenta TaxID=4460 RepID=A0A843WIF8_COLES|nr:hypothetical protein [Colocasia esculenta]